MFFVNFRYVFGRRAGCPLYSGAQQQFSVWRLRSFRWSLLAACFKSAPVRPGCRCHLPKGLLRSLPHPSSKNSEILSMNSLSLSHDFHCRHTSQNRTISIAASETLHTLPQRFAMDLAKKPAIYQPVFYAGGTI